MAFKRSEKRKIKALHGNECAVCGYNKYPQILECAHIVPECDNSDASEENTGILMCPNCHETYDRGLLKIEDWKKDKPEWVKKWQESGEFPEFFTKYDKEI